MRIGFDARMITHPGIGNYIRFLLDELFKTDSGNTYVLFGNTNIIKESIPEAGNAELVEWKAPIYSLTEQAGLPYRKMRLDLLHVPHFNVPLSYKGKMVVTVHDLIYVHFSRSPLFLPAKKYASYMIRNVLKKTEKVISVSEYTRNDLIKTFGDVYSGKIRTIYEAPAISFKRIKDQTQRICLKKKYNLKEKVMLYVGSIKPHKNVSTLIKVRKRLEDTGLNCQLVLVGKWDRKEDGLKKYIDGKKVIYLGEVSTPALKEIYSVSDILVHLSFYEGFGLTVLEAMECDIPVIISDTSSLREIAGRAALTVSPGDVSQIADTVYNVLMNKKIRQDMVKAGRERVGMFSWKRAAEETLKVYEEAAGSMVNSG